MAATIDRIVVTGDLLRPDGQNGPHSQTTNVMWLYNLLATQLREATGLPVAAITNQNAEFGFNSIYKLAGVSPNDDSWAALYNSAPPQVRSNWARQFDGAIVIGFELPPSLRAALSERGISFIDCMIHPVRFMDDIFLAMRSASAEINALLASRTLPARRVYAAAGAASALAYRKRLVRHEDPFSLFVGQMQVDRSMIVDGVLKKPDTLRSEIADAIGFPTSLKFSDHPLQKSDGAFAIVSAHTPHVERTAENTYALLANPALEKVISISSSVGIEVRFFGKDASYALGPSSPVLFRGEVDDDASYWSIFNDFMAADFWRVILAPLLSVTLPDGDGPLWRPGLLRSTLGVGWGYDQLFGVTSLPAALSAPNKHLRLRGSHELKQGRTQPLLRGRLLGNLLNNSVRGLSMALDLIDSGIRNGKPIVLHPRTPGPRAILVIDAGFLYVKSGSRQVLEAQLRALKSSGFKIDFLLVHPARAPKPRPISRKLLKQFPVEVVYEAGLDLATYQVPAAARWVRPSRVPGQRSLGELLAASQAMVTSREFEAQSKAQPYEIVLVNYVWNLPLALKIADRRSPVIVETIDVQSKQIAYHRGKKALDKNLKHEVSALSKADAVIALNAEEFQFFKDQIGPEKVRLLYPPAITDIAEEPGETLLERSGAAPWHSVPKEIETVHALFLGSAHDPNRQGFEWFVNSVLPIIQRDVPNFTLAIAGTVIQAIQDRGDDETLVADGVYPLGVVKQVAPLYRAAQIVIVPIRHGEGASIKTIEAFGFGKAVVTTSVGLRGLPQDIEHPSFDGAEEFAARVVALVKDDAKTKEAEEASLRIYRSFFQQENYNRKFREILSELGSVERFHSR